MPSTTSRVVSMALASSTVMTPSLPTFCIASAISSPTARSLLAAIVATWAISFRSLVALDIFFSAATTCSTAPSMPRLRAIGLAPAVTFLSPSRTIAWARTVAVVVPSPAMSEVLAATSLIICAPMFSNGSFSSSSFATVTPSLVSVGLPKVLSMTTFRPLGPSVTLTACDMMLTPRKSAARASSFNRTCLDMAMFLLSGHQWLPAAQPRVSRAENAEHVLLLHDEILLAVQRDLAAGVLAEQDPIAGPHRDHLALLGLLLGGVGDDDAAVRDLSLFEALDQDAVVERTKFRLRCMDH